MVEVEDEEELVERSKEDTVWRQQKNKCEACWMNTYLYKHGQCSLCSNRGIEEERIQ